VGTPHGRAHYATSRTALQCLLPRADANADRRTPDADRLGELIEFSFGDLKAMKRDRYSVRYVAPFDAQPWEVREFWESERKADRDRKQ
jgi:hypothetical protein